VANAWPSSTSIAGSPRTVLFQSARAGGSDENGVLSVVVKNTGDNDMEVRCSNKHGDDEYMTLEAGASVTFEVEDQGHNGAQIDTVEAWASGSSTTCTGGVVKWR